MDAIEPLYIGLMSGTSMDGVDAALVAFDGIRPTTLCTCYVAYPDEIKREALALNSAGPDELHRSAMLAQALSHLYAAACKQLLEQSGVQAQAIKAVGCHGQTLRHQPKLGYSIQLNNPALLAELTGIPVVADFRSRDVAAGGQGAPLVPAAHGAMFQSANHSRVLLNLGGIANITYLPAATAAGNVIGFDCGPANMLMDAWSQDQLGQPFDDEGHWALQGIIVPDLLKKMLANPFLTEAPPKSCGREEFNLRWLKSLLSGGEPAADVQRTLLELTLLTSTNAIKRWSPEVKEVYVCGGGARNTALMQMIKESLSPCQVSTTADLGIPPNWVEAVAFAWLAHQYVLGLPGNLPLVTGAKGSRILGAYYPA